MRIFKGFYKSLIWSFVILTLCLAPSNKISSINLFNIGHLDKAAHFLLYYIFALIIYADLVKYLAARVKKYYIILYALLVPLALGVLVELLQYYVFTTREGSIPDIAANICGITAGLFSVQLLKKYLP